MRGRDHDTERGAALAHGPGHSGRWQDAQVLGMQARGGDAGGDGGRKRRAASPGVPPDEDGALDSP